MVAFPEDDKKKETKPASEKPGAAQKPTYAETDKYLAGFLYNEPNEFIVDSTLHLKPGALGNLDSKQLSDLHDLAEMAFKKRQKGVAVYYTGKESLTSEDARVELDKRLKDLSKDQLDHLRHFFISRKDSSPFNSSSLPAIELIDKHAAEYESKIAISVEQFKNQVPDMVRNRLTERTKDLDPHFKEAIDAQGKTVNATVAMIAEIADTDRDSQITLAELRAGMHKMIAQENAAREKGIVNDLRNPSQIRADGQIMNDIINSFDQLAAPGATPPVATKPAKITTGESR